jgi:hypothetical protein
MGKKSRRNKKTGNDAATSSSVADRACAATATAAAAAASLGTTSSGCYHGSTIDKFQPNSEFMKAYKEYTDMCVQIENINDHDLQLSMKEKYDKDHKHIIHNPEFYRFIWAYCTEQYLKSNNLQEQDPKLRQEIWRLLTLGLIGSRNKISNEQCSKYKRDIRTNRGIINCLARETKTYCNCMREGKDIARTMEKIGVCYGCKQEFPKEALSLCNGCQSVKYHSRECQINNWPNHKLHCKKWQALLKENLLKEESRIKDIKSEKNN